MLTEPSTSSPASKAVRDPCSVLTRRRAWSLVLALTSLALLGIATAGVISEAAGYLLVDVVTSHRHALLLAALVSGLVAAIMWPSRKAGASVARGFLVAGLVVALTAGVTWASLTSGFTESRYASPDDRHILVVSEGAAMIDPLWDLSVQESSWALARTMSVACFNGDAPGDALASVAWVDDTTIEAVAASGEVHHITIGGSATTNFVSVGCDGVMGFP